MPHFSRRTLLNTALAVCALPVSAQSPAAPEKPVPAPTIPGPDPRTKTPAFKLPPKACDAHCHIFGPASVYPYAAKRSYTPPDAGLADFIALHKKIGVERAVIVNATVHGRDNRPVTDAIAEGKGAYLGVANVDETFTAKALRDLHDQGIRGCRFTFVRRLGNIPTKELFDTVIARIRPLGWHVDLYFEPQDIAEFMPMLDALPLPFVIDHMGGCRAADGLAQKPLELLVGLLKRNDRAWMKITGPERASATGAPFKDAGPIAQALIAAAPDRMLWGTDWPHPNVKAMPNDGDLVDLVPLYAPDEKVRHKLLVDNPAQFFGFGG